MVKLKQRLVDTMFLRYNSVLQKNIKKIQKSLRCPCFKGKSYSSVSLLESERFDRLSKDWWNPEGYLKLLHQMNTTRIEYIKYCLLRNEQETLDIYQTSNQLSKRQPLSGRWLSHLNVLDVGCGGGILSESLSRLGAASVLGIDISSKSIQVAKKHQKTDPSLTNLTYRETTAEALVKEEKRFNLITVMETIEHVNDPEAFLSKLFILLEPGGLLVLSTIERTFLSFLLTILIAERWLQLVPRQTHTWNKFVKQSEIKKWILYHPNISLIDHRGVIFIPWKNQWKLMNPNTIWAQQCNYFMAFRKST